MTETTPPSPPATDPNPALSVVTPVNRNPTLRCDPCDDFTLHRFVGKRPHPAHLGKLNVMFRCEKCQAERIYGQER